MPPTEFSDNRRYTPFNAESNLSMRLFCLPCAGGGCTLYSSWRKSLPAHVQLCAIQLPGREERFRETPFESMPPLVEALTNALSPYLDRPFAMLGHSMGALISFALAVEWRHRFGICPTHLFVSSCRAPQISQRLTNLHALSDEQFIEQLQHRYGGIPAAILADKEMMSLVLPAMKADMRLVESYRYLGDQQLDCDITCFGGRNDASLQLDELEAWNQVTRERAAIHMFDGGHHLIKSHQSQMAEIVAKQLQACAPLDE